jgi:hypothetical protein
MDSEYRSGSRKNKKIRDKKFITSSYENHFIRSIHENVAYPAFLMYLLNINI